VKFAVVCTVHYLCTFSSANRLFQLSYQSLIVNVLYCIGVRGASHESRVDKTKDFLTSVSMSITFRDDYSSYLESEKDTRNCPGIEITHNHIGSYHTADARVARALHVLILPLSSLSLTGSSIRIL